MALRARRAGGDSRETSWVTARGGLFIEPIARPETDAENKVTLSLTLSKSHYQLLEALYDDVPAYASRLLTSHVRGLIKSAEHNATRKRELQQ